VAILAAVASGAVTDVPVAVLTATVPDAPEVAGATGAAGVAVAVNPAEWAGAAADAVGVAGAAAADVFAGAAAGGCAAASVLATVGASASAPERLCLWPSAVAVRAQCSASALWKGGAPGGAPGGAAPLVGGEEPGGGSLGAMIT
jgi:hypothetical protein